MAKVYDLKGSGDLEWGLDALARKTGTVYRLVEVEDTDADDPLQVIADMLAATPDSEDTANSVLGMTLALGEPHPILDGDDERPLARVWTHRVTRMTKTIANVMVVYRTVYTSGFGFAGAGYTGSGFGREESRITIPIFRLNAEGDYVAGSMPLVRPTLYRVERQIVEGDQYDNFDPDTEADLAGKLFFEDRWLYLGAQAERVGAGDPRYLVSRAYMRINPVPAIDPGEGALPVPELDAFETLSVAYDGNGVPSYVVNPNPYPSGD